MTITVEQWPGGPPLQTTNPPHIGHGHGHGHGIFILATYPEGIWTTNPGVPTLVHPASQLYRTDRLWERIGRWCAMVPMASRIIINNQYSALKHRGTLSSVRCQNKYHVTVTLTVTVTATVTVAVTVSDSGASELKSADKGVVVGTFGKVTVR